MLLVSKLLALFVYPLSFFFILVVVSIVLRRRLSSRSANALTLLAVAWLYFCATEWGATLLLAPLERGYPAVETDALPSAGAIVVLGGGMTGESRFGLGGDLNAAADRLWHSAALFGAGKAPIMVLSGGAGLGQSTTEAELMLRALRAIGIDGPIELETQSQTTRENAYFTGKLLSARGITHIILVTSAAHMRRVCLSRPPQPIIRRPFVWGRYRDGSPRQSALPAPLVRYMNGWAIGSTSALATLRWRR